MASYLDVLGLSKVLSAIANKFYTKLDESDASINDGVITIKNNSITPLTSVFWDSITHQLKKISGTVTEVIIGPTPNGIPFLDSTGKIDSIFLPSYVDDIEEGILNIAEPASAENVYKLSAGTKTSFAVRDLIYDDVNSPNKLYIVKTAHTTTFDPTKCEVVPVFPSEGEKSKIYYDIVTDKTYRWGGTVYLEIIAHAGSTDDVPEGSVNLYFTAARAITALTPDLNERARVNGSTMEDFNAKKLTTSGLTTVKGGNLVVAKAVGTPVATIYSNNGNIVTSGSVFSPSIGPQVDNNSTPLNVNSALNSLIPSGSKPNIAYIIEPNDQVNPGIIQALTTSELYDIFVAAGIPLGSNRTEGEAILDGTNNV